LKKDPIKTFSKYLLENNICTENDLKDIQNKINLEISNAVEFAIKSPEPSLGELKKDIYA
jgi:pyruvate dehydrogenase E1 component alpha subunit